MGEGGNTFSISLNNKTISAADVPVAQVETATAAGTITASGNATVVVTGARITGSPVTVSVAVTNGDTAATWAGKVRTALAANTAISSVYTVGGSSTSIVLTETTPVYIDDTTLNISLANGTCTGITTAATSANTTAGVAGVLFLNSTGDDKDFEGITVAGTGGKALLIDVTNGTLGVNFAETASNIDMGETAKMLLMEIPGNEIVFTAGDLDTRFTLTYMAT